MAPPKGFVPSNKKIIDESLMKKLYYEDKLDYRQLADYFGFKSKSAIYDRFKRLGLRARDNTDLKTGFKHSEVTREKLSKALQKSWDRGERDNMKRPDIRGDKNPMFGKYGKDALNYKGGSIVKGYRRLCNNYKPMLEHRVVWEKHNGKIPDNMHIHHIDGDKLNNDISNLHLISPEDHSKLHNEHKPRTSIGRFQKK